MQTREGPDGASPPGGCLDSGEASTRLLIRAKAGDAEALDLLYRRYLEPLRRWARGRLPRWARDVADTDDMVQETMLCSLRGVDAFEPHYSGAFLAYLRRGVLNRMRDEIRRAGRRRAADGTASAVVDRGPSPLEETIRREVLECYETALGRLRPEDREAIVARVELGLSYQQVAAALGKPSPDAARVATARAVARLAREMSHGD